MKPSRSHHANSTSEKKMQKNIVLPGVVAVVVVGFGVWEDNHTAKHVENGSENC